MNIIGIDYGSKIIGISISSPDLSYALPLTKIYNSNSFLQELEEIIVENNVTKIVIGFPKTFNNYISERHYLITSFINQVKDKFKDLEIYIVDESYSTKISKDLYFSANLKNKTYKKNKDITSACIILETFLKSEKQK